MPSIQSTCHLVVSLMVVLTSATPLHRRQAPCFLTGTDPLPEETLTIANDLASSITCSSTTTIGTVPDVTTNGLSFSAIDFSSSSSSPLQFALDTFATADPLASTSLADFETMLNLYLATEAGIRSEGGNLAIKVPKFFLAMQVARIKTAQGVPIEEAGQQVLHLRDKVTKNAAGESAGLLAQVTALAADV